MGGVTDVTRLEALVRGRVQGVGFRVYALGVARGLGLRGWVANESAGTVRVVAEGAAADLDRLVAALRDGPPSAHVERVDERRSPATGEFTGFSIRSGWHSGD
jgi:acylphosphatase